MIGKNIRDLRKKKSMTLEQLSSIVGITPGGLSQVERDIVDPSLSLLKKLAAALGISLHMLFSEETGNYISRSKDRKKVYFCDNNLCYEFLTPRPTQGSIVPKIEVNMVTLNGNTWGSDTYTSHTADECFIVIKGLFEIHIEGEEPTVLYENDCIYHTAGVNHRIYNPSNSDATALSVLSDIVY